MSERGRASGPSWRGPPVGRWTLALVLALCAVAALVAEAPAQWTTVSGRPTPWWDAPAPPVTTVAALLALGAALWASMERTSGPGAAPGRGGTKKKRTPLVRGPLR